MRTQSIECVRDADGVIFSKGEPLHRVERDDIFDALFEEIEKDGWK